MKYFTVVVAFTGVWAVQGSAPNARRSIPVSALTETPVVGDFRLPIGTVTRVRCHLVANPNAGVKSNKSMAPFLLAVTSINQEQLSSPLMVDFKVSPQSRKAIPIYQSPLQFAQAKFAGTKVKPTTDAGAQMATQWLGKQIDCLAYETGTFTGHPRYAKELAPRTVVASRGFHFHRYVILMDPNDW